MATKGEVTIRPFDELETLVLPVRGISLRNKLMNECQEVVSTTLGCCKVIVEAILDEGLGANAGT